jgi:hypothetical protein
MLVANGERGGAGDKLLILGLTAANVERLMRGQPIHVRRAVHGAGVPPGWEVLLVYGQDEASLRAQLGPGVGPGTKVYGTPGLDDANPENS